ncbi:hypothetical protein JXB27_03880 [Candidatus Woesearchaeota archaeon]|nr:hypothetical protein [Candidatus Woesearchaeota archaeon]
MIMSYLGPRGTFTEKAAHEVAEKIKKETKLLPLKSLEDVAMSLTDRRADIAVMAYYNYISGPVKNCLNLINNNNHRIIGIQRIPIELAVCCHPESSDFSVLYSHPNAIKQCSEYFAKNYPEIKKIEVESTATGMEFTKESKKGLAVGMKEAMIEMGLKILAENIGNKTDGIQNYTDFYIVVPGSKKREEKFTMFLEIT